MVNAKRFYKHNEISVKRLEDVLRVDGKARLAIMKQVEMWELKGASMNLEIFEGIEFLSYILGSCNKNDFIADVTNLEKFLNYDLMKSGIDNEYIIGLQLELKELIEIEYAGDYENYMSFGGGPKLRKLIEQCFGAIDENYEYFTTDIKSVLYQSSYIEMFFDLKPAARIDLRNNIIYWNEADLLEVDPDALKQFKKDSENELTN